MKKPLILETKLIPPDCSRMLPRIRLVDDFSSSDERLTVLCADAGYGKTTLMGQFYQSLRDSQGIWYQFSSADRALAVFLAHMVEGVNRHLPEFGVSLERALPGKMDDADKCESYLTVFINEISGAATAPFVFFFDEFQLVKDFEYIAGAVQFLITHLPPDFRVVIASRGKPSLSLGRLRTQRNLKEIDTEDLRFTIEEMAEIFNGCCGRELDEEELKVWYAATEGWPVAIVLARNLLTVDRRLPIHVNPELLGVHGAIAGYLAEEVWSELSDELQQFLIETSILEAVEVRICDQALTAGDGKPNSARHLRELETRNLMITCLEEGKSYIYQPLVRQFLKNKLEQSMPISDIDALNGRYGKAYADHEQYDFAIHHFLESRSPALAVDIIETKGGAILEAGHYDTVAEWLSQIPEDTIMVRPWMSYYSARTSEHKGDVELAVRWYKAAADGFARDGDSDGLFACALSQAEFFFMRDMHAQSLENAAESLKWAMTPEQKVAALSRMATQNLLLGFGQEALELMEQATDLCDVTMVETRFVLATNGMASSWFAGEFQLLQDKAVELQGESSMRSPMLIRFYILTWKIFSLYEMGRYEEALAAIAERSEYLGDEDQQLRMGYEFLRGVVLLNIEDGDTGQKIIEALDREVGDSRVLGPFYSPKYLGSHFRRQGDLDKAIEAHSMYLHHRDGGNQYSAASCLVNLGADRLRRKHDDPQGINDLEEAQILAVRHGYKYISTQVHYIFACSAFEDGDEERALVEIGKSLQLAALYQHNNFIIQEGRISTGLLALAFMHDIEREYMIGILPSIGPIALEDFASLLNSGSPQIKAAAITALTASGGVAAAPYIRRVLRDQDVSVRRAANAELRCLRSTIDAPEEILTRRENQVMELMAEGMSNAELAERLYISEPTAKTHISSIFRKLGLTSRSQVAAIYQKNNNCAGSDESGRGN
ncbi:MAG: LuxR C-terminal-related transcriptional regulator [Thermoleophilia bacterium]|nr:LuxR C-terminal-related transcriptional regulator [Thermoleophilia bacterium]